MPDITTQGIALRRHDIDFAGVDSSQYALLRGEPNLRSAIEPFNDFVALALNTQRPVLADLRVRRAIAMAIDRERITRDNTYGTGTTAYADLPFFLWTRAEPRSPTPFDVKAAAALLDAAGWRTGGAGLRERNGRPLHLDGIAFAGSATGRSVYIQVQQMLRAVGIDVTFKYFAPELYFAPAAAGGPLALGRYDVASFALSAGSDPRNDEIFTCLNRAPSGQNFARYCSRRMDALQAASLEQVDPAARLRIVAQIEGLAASDVPYVFFYYTPKRLFWVPALHRTPSNLTSIWYDLRHWTLDRAASGNAGTASPQHA
jgi:peptide/nickel transport system substrate-binding protein